MIKLLDILSEIKINEPPSFDSKTVISQITQAFEEAENNDERIEKIEEFLKSAKKIEKEMKPIERERKEKERNKKRAEVFDYLKKKWGFK